MVSSQTDTHHKDAVDPDYGLQVGHDLHAAGLHLYGRVHAPVHALQLCSVLLCSICMFAMSLHVCCVNPNILYSCVGTVLSEDSSRINNAVCAKEMLVCTPPYTLCSSVRYRVRYVWLQ